MEVLFLSKGKLYQVLDQWIAYEVDLEIGPQSGDYYLIKLEVFPNGMPEKFKASLQEVLERLGTKSPKEELIKAFVKGAQWWEFETTEGTMWPSDRNQAEAEAERRYKGAEE